MAGEACAGCGEKTAIGSAFHSNRRQIALKDGSHAFICTDCDGRIAASRRGSRMTEEELRQAIRMGSISMIAARPGGNLPPGG